MGAVYKSICFEADTLLLHVTALAEKEIFLKVNIEKYMNEGFVNIAKARYIMGSTCVTKMQLPTKNSNPIKPLATVCRKEVNNSWIFYIDRKSFLKSDDSNSGIHKESHGTIDEDCENTDNHKTFTKSINRSEADFKNVLQNDPKSLKKSKNAFLVGDDLYQSYNDELLDEMSNSGSNESLVSVTDPIRLFGILVPEALKQAQINFIDVVDLLGECASVQLELKEALQKLNHLERVKRLVEAASKKTKIDILTPRVYWTPTESSSDSCYSVELEEEEEETEKKLLEKSNVSIQKSIRSVFYDFKNIPSEEAEFSVWGSDNTEFKDDN